MADLIDITNRMVEFDKTKPGLLCKICKQAYDSQAFWAKYLEAANQIIPPKSMSIKFSESVREHCKLLHPFEWSIVTTKYGYNNEEE